MPSKGDNVFIYAFEDNNVFKKKLQCQTLDMQSSKSQTRVDQLEEQGYSDD
ncbi:hypothetical protein JHK85_034740 [Glycine max]|nr:hypothetical protein JHK85_034740 [Glycine max]